jgi:hypothetical protein
VPDSVKHGGGSLIIWAAVSFYSADPLITLHDRITVSECRDILSYRVHPVAQVFPDNDAKFQDDNSPIHTHSQKCSFFGL